VADRAGDERASAEAGSTHVVRCGVADLSMEGGNLTACCLDVRRSEVQPTEQIF